MSTNYKNSKWEESVAIDYGYLVRDMATVFCLCNY